jgi:hypothetical protein
MSYRYTSELRQRVLTESYKSGGKLAIRLAMPSAPLWTTATAMTIYKTFSVSATLLP